MPQTSSEIFESIETEAQAYTIACTDRRDGEAEDAVEVEKAGRSAGRTWARRQYDELDQAQLERLARDFDPRYDDGRMVLADEYYREMNVLCRVAQTLLNQAHS